MKDTLEIPSQRSVSREILRLPVIVAALGYMVDLYDLFLFSIVRVVSLRSLHLSESSITEDGVMLLNLQMAGLLIGGIFWGILGDKKGRLSVLFGSILIYSLANIGNGFVTSLSQYAVLRFIAGFGLAGELGAGMTLVTEILPKKMRGYGAVLVSSLGVIGALLAYISAKMFDWRVSYGIGGILGLLLLVLRFKVFESGIFVKLKEKKVSRGDISMLFNNKKRFIKYLTCIIVGMPIWFVAGILVTFSPEIGKSLGITEPLDAGKAILYYFTAQIAGNIVSGFISQYFESRKKAIFIFIIWSFASSMAFLLSPFKTASSAYWLLACIGFGSGYWTLFITVGAELFGSNLRATVATTIPNFVRGTTIPLASTFLFLKGQMGTIYSALIVGVTTYFIAVVALTFVEETFKKDLNYVEGEEGNGQ